MSWLIKRLLTLIVLLACLLFCGCGDGETPSRTTTGTLPAGPTMLGRTDLSSHLLNSQFDSEGLTLYLYPHHEWMSELAEFFQQPGEGQAHFNHRGGAAGPMTLKRLDMIWNSQVQEAQLKLVGPSQRDQISLRNLELRSQSTLPTPIGTMNYNGDDFELLSSQGNLLTADPDTTIKFPGISVGTFTVEFLAAETSGAQLLQGATLNTVPQQPLTFIVNDSGGVPQTKFVLGNAWPIAYQLLAYDESTGIFRLSFTFGFETLVVGPAR